MRRSGLSFEHLPSFPVRPCRAGLLFRLRWWAMQPMEMSTTTAKQTVNGITYCRCAGLTLASATRVSLSLSFVVPKASLLVAAGDFVGNPPCTSLLVAVGGLVGDSLCTSLLVAVGGLVVDPLCTSLLVAVGGLVGDPLCTRVVIVGGLVGKSCCDGEETSAVTETGLSLVCVGVEDCGSPFEEGGKAAELDWVLTLSPVQAKEVKPDLCDYFQSFIHLVTPRPILATEYKYKQGIQRKGEGEIQRKRDRGGERDSESEGG